MIPLANPKANYLAHKAEIDAAVARVMASGTYIGGGEVARFEQEFAAFIGTKYAIGVGNGTDALRVALMALGYGPGTTVMTTATTALATIAAVLSVGAIPLLVEHDDIDVAVHLYGKAASAKRAAIEDCAQSCGGFCGNQRLGTFGDLACFSFYPTKNLSALGDGGMIVTDDEFLSEACRQIREYGWVDRVPKRIGFNSRLDPIQAAILRVKLKYLDEENARRRTIAEYYAGSLKEFVEVPDPTNHCFHLYVIECDERAALMAHLQDCGVETGIHYKRPVHREPIYKDLVKTNADLSAVDKRAQRILSLPMYPELSAGEIDKVISAVRSFYV